MNRLKEKYIQEVTPSMVEKFGYKSIMQTPKVDKIVINMGVGDAVSNAKNLDKAVDELTVISGQKPLGKLGIISKKLAKKLLLVKQQI